MRLMVAMFCDGSEVDYAQMQSLGLIELNEVGYVLTPLGRALL